MQRIFALSSLSTLVAASLLTLLVPPAFCAQDGSCQMAQARGGDAAEAPCVPGATFDCCGDSAPPTRGSDQLGSQQLAAGTVGGSMPIVVETAAGAWFRGGPGRLPPPAEVPLYTLFSTLLN